MLQRTLRRAVPVPRGRGAFLEYLMQFRADGGPRSVAPAAAAWEALPDAERAEFERRAGQRQTTGAATSGGRGGVNGYNAFLRDARARRDSTELAAAASPVQWRRDMALRWRQLSDAERAAWRDRAAAESAATPPHPAKPRGGCSPYLLFAREVGPQLRGHDVAARVAAQWRALSATERAYYQAVASVTPKPRPVPRASAPTRSPMRERRGPYLRFYRHLLAQRGGVTPRQAAQEWKLLSPAARAEFADAPRAMECAATAPVTDGRRRRQATLLSLFRPSRPPGESMRDTLAAFKALPADEKALLRAAAADACTVPKLAVSDARPERKSRPTPRFAAFASHPRMAALARGSGQRRRMAVLKEHFANMSPQDVALLPADAPSESDAVQPPRRRGPGRPRKDPAASPPPARRGPRKASRFATFVARLAKERHDAPPVTGGFLSYAARKYRQQRGTGAALGEPQVE